MHEPSAASGKQAAAGPGLMMMIDDDVERIDVNVA